MFKLPGFKNQKLSTYAGTSPEFVLRKHLSGEMISEGMIYGPTGNVVSRFVADMHGSWNGAQGTLTENFRYASGGTQDRAWSLVEANDGLIIATAEDIIGQGL